MIRNYFRVIYIIIDKTIIIIAKIIIKSIQSAHNVPGTSPEGHLKVLTSRTYSGLSGDQYKNLWFYEKAAFQK